MDHVPTEILRRIPALLDSRNVSRAMRAGSRRLYEVCGEVLYADIHLSMSQRASQNVLHATRIHGRPMLELLSSDTPRGSLQHPAKWVRHLVVVWPLFPTGEEDEYCSVLLRALSRTDTLLSLELRGRSPPAWRHGLPDPAHSSQLLSELVALKTDDIKDSIDLSTGRRLESIFVTVPSSSADFAALLGTVRHHSVSLTQLQLSLEVDSIEETQNAFDTIVADFRNLRALCLEFDLGIDFPERPLAWSTMNNTLASMGQSLHMLHRLHSISITIFPEPVMNADENIKAIQLLSAHCNTLRHVEVRWCRKDENEYNSVFTRDGLLRGRWAYETPSC